MKKLYVIIFLSFLLAGCYSDTYVSYEPQSSTYNKSVSLGSVKFNAIVYYHSGQYNKYSGIGPTADLAIKNALNNCYKKHT